MILVGKVDDIMIDRIVVDTLTGDANLYFEQKNVRNVTSVMKMFKDKKMKFLGDKHGDFSSAWTMLNELMKYEKKRERHFDNSDYEARFGAVFNVMLPKVSKSWTDKTLLDIARKIVSFIVGEEKNLGWVAFSMKRKDTVFLKIWVCDRPFYDYMEVKRYNRNIYVSKETNKFCKSTAVDAVLTHKKGDVITDSEGNPCVVKEHFYPRKSRIFCYASESAFTNFCTQLKNKLAGIITSLRGEINVKKEMIIRRKKLKRIWNQYIRNITASNNRARAYIQDGFNVAKAEIGAMFPTKMNPWEFNDPDRIHVLPDQIAMKLKEIFSKYTDIFKNDAFAYNGVTLSIFGGPPAVVEEACALLMRMFDRDIASVRRMAAAAAC